MNIIPSNIQKELAEYIKNRCPRAENGWNYSNQDEDTITGDFLGNLRSDGWRYADNFRYNFYYNKIRGRGKNALEKRTGADGMVTIELDENGIKTYKSFAFQAKKVGNRTNPSQIEKMKIFFPKGNVVFRYGPEGYYLENYDGSEMKICEYIYNVFLKCKHGIVGLRYDHKKNIFIDGGRRFSDKNIDHELLIEVKI